jgi:hypothetical protein
MSEIILYTTANGLTKINVQLEDETVWLTIDQMAELLIKVVLQLMNTFLIFTMKRNFEKLIP